VPTSKGEGREGNGKRKGREEGKGQTPVPDCESAKVATLKCGVRHLCLRRIGVRGQKSLKTAALQPWGQSPSDADASEYLMPCLPFFFSICTCLLL